MAGVLSAALTASLAACHETIARMDSDAVVEVGAVMCPEATMAVGDSLQMSASVIIRATSGGMSMPGDGETHYTSAERPGSFRWSLRYPPARPPGAAYDPPATSEISRTGVLVPRKTGVVFVEARSAGKVSEGTEIRVIPRVTRFSVTPRDTSIRVGDTLTVHTDFALDGTHRRGHDFLWMLPYVHPDNRLISPVEIDPDTRGPGMPVPPPEFELTLAALRPGTVWFAPCAGGTHRDTVTIRILGALPVVNRDVPPRLRLTPAETTVFVGEQFSSRLRILSANLNNGPYRVRATAGNGRETVDSIEWVGETSAFGFERHVILDEAYVAAGKFPVAVTVTDGAGRSTTLATTYTAVDAEYALVLQSGNGKGVVSLSDGDPNLSIAILGDEGKRLDPRDIVHGAWFADEIGVPPLRFGRTVFEAENDGRRRRIDDVNGDGHPPDLIMDLDRATMIRNGDLRLGRNRLVMTGGIQRYPARVPGKYVKQPVFTKVRGVVEFTVIP